MVLGAGGSAFGRPGAGLTGAHVPWGAPRPPVPPSPRPSASVGSGPRKWHRWGSKTCQRWAPEEAASKRALDADGPRNRRPSDRAHVALKNELLEDRIVEDACRMRRGTRDTRRRACGNTTCRGRCSARAEAQAVGYALVEQGFESDAHQVLLGRRLHWLLRRHHRPLSWTLALIVRDVVTSGSCLRVPLAPVQPGPTLSSH